MSIAQLTHASTASGSEIMRIPLNGPAQLVADPSKTGLSSDNYRFSGITPAGAPMVESEIGTGNLYSITYPR